MEGIAHGEIHTMVLTYVLQKYLAESAVILSPYSLNVRYHRQKTKCLPQLCFVCHSLVRIASDTECSAHATLLSCQLGIRHRKRSFNQVCSILISPQHLYVYVPIESQQRTLSPGHAPMGCLTSGTTKPQSTFRHHSSALAGTSLQHSLPTLLLPSV